MASEEKASEPGPAISAPIKKTVKTSAAKMRRQAALGKSGKKGMATAGSAASEFHKRVVRNRYPYTVAVVGPKGSGKSTLVQTLRDGVTIFGGAADGSDKVVHGMGRGIEQPGNTPSGLDHSIIYSTKFALDLIDTPGGMHTDDGNPLHGRREVITAINQCDACMLVLSSDLSEHSAAWRSGEIQEYVKLIKVLEKSTRLIVVINKLDASPPNNIRSRFMKVRMPVHRFIDKTFGVESKKLLYLGASGQTGENALFRVDKFPVSNKDRAPFIKHYFDMYLWPADRGEHLKRALRIPVQDVYEDEDNNLIAVGRVETGIVRLNDAVSLAPGMVYTDVKAIYKINEDPNNPRYNPKMAQAGESVHVVVGNEVTLGSVIGLIKDEARSPHMAYLYEALVTVLPDAKDFNLYEELEWEIDYTVVSEVGSVKKLKYKVNPKTLRPSRSNKKVTNVRAGESVICEIQSDCAVAIEVYEEYPPLGRFLFRKDGRVVAVGTVRELLEH